MTIQQFGTYRLRTVAIALANNANTRLLESVLDKGQYAIVDIENASIDTDLIVIDVILLKRRRELIRHLRARSDPVVLPVLLIADDHTRSRPGIAAELGGTVDDILRVPTSKSELKARVDNLLRLRALSRQQGEIMQQLSTLNGSLRTLNDCDGIIVRAKSEEELLTELCKAVVDQGGYSLACVAFAADQTGGTVRVRAQAGRAVGFLRKMGEHLDPQNAFLIGATICARNTQVVPDIASEPRLSFLHEHARGYGLTSIITLPLLADTGPLGCLAIYSDRNRRFGEDERLVLERLAGNLVFGLNALRTQRDRERQAAEIHSLAYTDMLTGLPNRRYLVRHLDKMLENVSSHESIGAILFLDLDGFKLINDALGHKVGDDVLQRIGQRLQGAVRESDLVVRQGGDEFLIVMIDEPRSTARLDSGSLVKNAEALAERIVQNVKEPIIAGGYAHQLKASIGISLWPEHGCDAATLIENADKAMYEAKKSGGGRAQHFNADIAANRHQRISMESRLRIAVERQDFILHYQPIFELKTSRIVAAEALVRWPQQDGSVLMPGSFMPLVEETGLINPLGNWVLESAAEQLALWHKRGSLLEMAVNLSINQLHPKGNAANFAKLVRPHVDPSFVHLEVTENALMADPEAIRNLLEVLSGEGFHIAIDDFGTGYSSLSRLQHLSIDSLKIDRSFVSQLQYANSKGAALVGIIQQMARNLNLQTIAEGIETEEQRQILLRNSDDCGWGQGYLFSPPIPADEFTSLLFPEHQAETSYRPLLEET